MASLGVQPSPTSSLPYLGGWPYPGEAASPKNHPQIVTSQASRLQIYSSNLQFAPPSSKFTARGADLTPYVLVTFW